MGRKMMSNDEKNMTNIDFNNAVIEIISSLKDLLIEKNVKYGNSAMNPIYVFVDPNGEVNDLTLIDVRIDDKLARIRNMVRNPNLFEKDGEDTINDLIGYLIIRKIKVKEMEKPAENIIVGERVI